MPEPASGDLFEVDPSINLLPVDGIVNHHGRVFGVPEAWRIFEILMRTVPWRRDEVVLYGRRIVTAREVAWYGDEPFLYNYSGTSKRALPWTDELLEVKGQVERSSGELFNSCLLNLYHDGDGGMSWHSDDEKMLVRHGAIASVSLGAERRFVFKHKESKETVALMLEHGSLLVMKGATQTHWLHSLPKSKRVSEPRINLTFRQIAGE